MLEKREGEFGAKELRRLVGEGREQYSRQSFYSLDEGSITETTTTGSARADVQCGSSSANLNCLARGWVHGVFEDFSENKRLAMMPITGIEPPKPPRIAEVTFEEIEGDLGENVKTKPMKEPVRSVRVRFRDKHWDKSFDNKEDDGSYILTFDSDAHFKDVGNSYEMLLPVHTKGVKIVEVLQTRLDTTWSKTFHVSQKIRVVRNNDFIGVASIQLYCNAKCLKCNNDIEYHEGDIITVFIHDTGDGDIAGMLSVPFTEFPTYLSLLPGQRLQVVSFSNGEITLHGDHQCLSFEESSVLCNSHMHQVRGRKISSYIYRCLKRPSVEHSLEWAKGDKRRHIIVPTLRKHSRYAVIDSPAVSFLVRGSNLDGFILKCQHQVVIESGCPLTEIYSSYSSGFFEKKMRIDRLTAYFLVDWNSKNKYWMVQSL